MFSVSFLREIKKLQFKYYQWDHLNIKGVLQEKENTRPPFKGEIMAKCCLSIIKIEKSYRAKKHLNYFNI